MTQSKKKEKSEPVFYINSRLLIERYPDVWTQVLPLLNSTHSAGKNDRDIGIATALPKETRILISREEKSRNAVRKWVAESHYEHYDTLFLIGLGFGFLVEEATNRNIGNPRLIVIEPSLEMFYIAMATNDLETLLTDNRIELFVGDHISVSDIVTQTSDIIPLGEEQDNRQPKLRKHSGRKNTSDQVGVDRKNQGSQRQLVYNQKIRAKNGRQCICQFA